MLFNEVVSLGSFLFVLRLRQYAIVGPGAGHGVQHHSCLVIVHFTEGCQMLMSISIYQRLYSALISVLVIRHL